MARVAITGGGGQLGRQLDATFRDAGHVVWALTHEDVDIGRPATLERLVDWRPDIVVNAAAWTDVDGCAREPSRAMAINGDGAGAVAAAAARAGASVVQVSTNEVFDGRRDEPYGEDDPTNPINAYGASKLAGERAVAAENSRHVIVRTAWLFGPGGTNFVTKIVAAAERAVASGSPMRIVDDEWGNPTWTPDLARAIAGLATDKRAPRVVHAAGVPAATRLDWAGVALEAAGVEVDIEPVALASFERASTPPARAVLRPSAGLPPMEWRPVTLRYAPTTRAQPTTAS